MINRIRGTQIYFDYRRSIWINADIFRLSQIKQE